MIVYLQDKRREFAEWAGKLQHAVAGFPLLFAGLDHLSDEAERPLAFLEIGIAVLVLGSLVYELRAWRHHVTHGTEHHPPVGWFDLAAAAMLIFEAFHGAHHKPGYLRPQFLSAMATLGLGLFHRRLHHFKSRRRHLTVDESGVKLRMSPWRRFAAEWKDLSAIAFPGSDVEFRHRSGEKRKIGLARYRNADEVRKALAEHASRAGIEAPPPPGCAGPPASSSLGTDVPEP